MKSKILIVDDDVDILESLTALLDAEGYETFSTLKGDETYKLVKKHKPDLLIVDLLLSGRDGGQITSDLRNNPTTKDIPIIMISAHPSAKNKAIDVGANDFVAKPFETESFLEIIDRNIKSYSNTSSSI